MKIFHIITTLNRGGAENHLVSLTKGQKELGHEIQIAFLKGDAYWVPMLEKEGITTLSLGLKSYGEMAPLLKLIQAFKRFSPDIVHAHMPPAELYSRLALLFYSPKVPFFVSKHNDEPFANIPGAHALARWMGQRAEKIICISKAVERYMQKEVRLSSSQLVTIHYGLDPYPYGNISLEDKKKLREEWGVQEEDFLIGTVARLVPQKSLSTLLEGFALYLQKEPELLKSRSRLVIVGEGPLKEELIKKSRQLKLENSLLFAGFRDDIPRVLNTFDVFCLPSLYEGFGLVLIEAMASGTPLIASAVSAIPEIIEEGKSGLLIPPQDPESLALALEKMKDDQYRHQLAREGLRRVTESFSLEKMILNTLGLYEKVLGKQF